MTRKNHYLDTKACKNCNKQFIQTTNRRPKIFCCVECRDEWRRYKGQTKDQLYRKRKLASSNFYLVPVFNKEIDIERLGKAIIAHAEWLAQSDRQRHG